MNFRKRIGILLSCIALLFFILVVADTYAKYLTEAAGTTNIAIARWRILVNGQDIRDNQTISQTITPVLYTDPNIAQNVIAPRSRGYFDITINCADADVSFQYDISISPNEDSSVTDLIATGYSIGGGATTPLDRGDDITQQVLISNNPGTINIRIYIEWDDVSQDAEMDNDDDTAATESGDPAKLDVNLSFRQIATTTTTTAPSNNP